MSNYGRNFEFRASPHRNQRAARYVLETQLPIGVPVVVTGDADAQGRLPVDLAPSGSAIPTAGQGGIVVYEHAPVAFSGYDTAITTYSDIDFAPANQSVQVVYGDDVKVAFTNTETSTFYTRTNYPKARVMVDGIGASSLAVGDLLMPGDGNDTDGYWTFTSDPTKGWLTVTFVDASTGEVEAQLNF